MLTAFKKYITEKAPVTEDEWIEIEAVCTVKKLRKHQYLLQDEFVPSKVYRLLSATPLFLTNI